MSLNSKVPRKVLILRLSSLGDIVQSTAALAPLRAAGCSIFFLTKPVYGSFVEECMSGVRSHIYHTSGGEAKASKDFFLWLEREKFDCILDLHDSLRTKLWRARLRKISSLYVAHKPRWVEFLVLFLRRGKQVGLGRGWRARNFHALASRAMQDLYGEEPREQKKLTVLQPPSRYSMDHGLPRSYMVLLPGSAWKGKRWSLDRFISIAQYFSKKLPVVVLGGKEDFFCDRIAQAAQLHSPESVSLRGKTTLADCVRILSQARAVVGNDTGLIHIAEALGKNVVVIEGPTSPALGYSAYRDGSHVLGVDLWCRPCSKSGKTCWRLGSRVCMKKITEAMVIQKANLVLEESGRSFETVDV